MNITKNINDIKTDILRNRNIGNFSWLLHRITGLLLVFYICLHLCVLGSSVLFGEKIFNLLMENFDRPLVKIMEIALIGVVGFHMLNGLRVIFADFFGMTRAHRILFWIVMLILITALVIISLCMM